MTIIICRITNMFLPKCSEVLGYLSCLYRMFVKSVFFAFQIQIILLLAYKCIIALYPETPLKRSFHCDLDYRLLFMLIWQKGLVTAVTQIIKIILTEWYFHLPNIFQELNIYYVVLKQLKLQYFCVALHRAARTHAVTAEERITQRFTRETPWDSQITHLSNIAGILVGGRLAE